jgi:hypothetical protein
MAVSQAELYSRITFIDGEYNVFGHKGCLDGNRWVMYFGGLPVVVTPELASKEIEEVILDDCLNGNESKVDHVVVSPNCGLRLLLEGKIAYENAYWDNEEHAILFKDIEFVVPKGKFVLNVYISTSTEYEFGTYDKNGNLV